MKIKIEAEIFNDAIECYSQYEECSYLVHGYKREQPGHCKLFRTNLLPIDTDDGYEKCGECKKAYQNELEKTQIKFGCHVDLFLGEFPDDCVIDNDDHDDCTHARQGMKKEDCKFWYEIKKE